MLIQRHIQSSETSSHPNRDIDTTTLRKSDHESQLYVAIRGLQSEIRRTQLADPNLSQSHIFRNSAPLAIFLYLFVVGMTVPRHPATAAYVATFMETTGSIRILVALSVLGVGALLILVILWALIWPLARVLQYFCEWDLTELNGARTDQLGEYEFSQANMLFGGLFT